MNDTKYNGWTNYATWRVNLEMFDGMEAQDLGSFTRYAPEGCLEDCADELKDLAEESISQQANGLALDYALAFLSDVNWREIAQSKIDAWAEEYNQEESEA